MHTAPSGALSLEADAPDMYCEITVFSQAPKRTGPGVHLPDNMLPGAILCLQGDVEKEGQASPSQRSHGVPGGALGQHNVSMDIGTFKKLQVSIRSSYQ